MSSYINGCELSIFDNFKRENLSLTNFFGPVNYVQLIGNINNIQKNITIFIDVHLDLNNQTRCDSFDSVDSVDISYYLYNVIKNTTSPLDFFMEIRQTDLFKDKNTIQCINFIPHEATKLYISNIVLDSLSHSHLNFYIVYLHLYNFLFFFQFLIYNLILYNLILYYIIYNGGSCGYIFSITL